MGSFRRRISLFSLLMLTASPAMAEVCGAQRPDWIPSDGAVSSVGEALYLFTSLPGLAILGAFVLALTRGTTLDWLLASFLPVVVGISVAVGATGDTNVAAQAEGCAGPPGLSVTLCIALAATAIALGVVRRRQPPSN